MRAIRISAWGGPEVLELAEDAPVPEPGRARRARPRHARGHQLRRHPCARELLPRALRAPAGPRRGGRRRGRARRPRLPGRPARRRARRHRRLRGVRRRAGRHDVRACPTASSDGTAVALLLQGLTAWHLYRTCARLAPGESVVVHAAAGGVGSLAVQLGKPLGAGRVIATASTEEKRALALELGADAAVDVTREDLAEALVEANLGERVDIVLEMAGGRVFDASLDALAPFGRLVTYGIASREANTVSSGALMRKSRARDRLLADALPPPPGRAGRGAAAGSVRARRAPASCGSSRARPTRSRRSAARTRISRPAAPPASSCSTRRAS